MTQVRPEGTLCCAFMTVPTRPTPQNPPVTYPTVYKPYKAPTVRDDAAPMPLWRQLLKAVAYTLSFCFCAAAWLGALMLLP